MRSDTRSTYEEIKDELRDILFDHLIDSDFDDINSAANEIMDLLERESFIKVSKP